MEDIDRCRLAIDTAFKIASEECGSKDELKKYLGDVLGVNPDNPAGCEVVLENLSEEVCRDFRNIRKYVLCNTWRLIDKEKKSFREAISDSWRIVKSKCAEMGVYV